MNPQDLASERAKYGIPAQGYSSTQSQDTTNQRLSALDAAWTKNTPPPVGSKERFDAVVAQDPIQQLATGAIKGAVSTAQNIGNVIAKPLASAIDKISLKPGEQPQPVGFDEKTLEPSNTTQKVGKFAEQTAEFALPLGEVSAATKGINLISDAAKVPKAVKLIVNTLPRAAAEGLTSAGVVSAQTGEVDKDAAVAGLISGAIPFGGAAANALKTSMGPDLSARIINSLIKPLSKDFSYGKNPGRAVAEEGITGSSLEEIGNGIKEKLDLRLTQLENTLTVAASAGKKVNLSGVLKPVDEAISEAREAPNTNSDVIKRLQGLKEDLMGIKTDEEGNITEARNFGLQEPGQATGFKRLVGSLTKFTGRESDDKTVNAALKNVYGLIKDKINAVVPEAKDLNERIADLISAKTATEYRDVVNQRLNLAKIGDFRVGATGALVTSLATGGAAIPSLIVGLGAAGLRRAMASPTVKTNLAAWLAKTAPADQEVLFQKAPWAKGILTELLPKQSQ